jgi:hypothetical protein
MMLYCVIIRIYSRVRNIEGADTNGFPAVPRSVIDGAGQWTMVQRQGFPSDGIVSNIIVSGTW